jgi:hypothetical protein
MLIDCVVILFCVLGCRLAKAMAPPRRKKRIMLVNKDAKIVPPAPGIN